jgi:hypothetical protein
MSYLDVIEMKNELEKYQSKNLVIFEIFTRKIIILRNAIFHADNAFKSIIQYKKVLSKVVNEKIVNFSKNFNNILKKETHDFIFTQAKNLYMDCSKFVLNKFENDSFNSKIIQTRLFNKNAESRLTSAFSVMGQVFQYMVYKCQLSRKIIIKQDLNTKTTKLQNANVVLEKYIKNFSEYTPYEQSKIDILDDRRIMSIAIELIKPKPSIPYPRSNELMQLHSFFQKEESRGSAFKPVVSNFLQFANNISNTRSEIPKIIESNKEPLSKINIPSSQVKAIPIHTEDPAKLIRPMPSRKTQESSFRKNSDLHQNSRVVIRKNNSSFPKAIPCVSKEVVKVYRIEDEDEENYWLPSQVVSNDIESSCDENELIIVGKKRERSSDNDLQKSPKK